MTSAYTSLAETQARGCTKPKGSLENVPSFCSRDSRKGFSHHHTAFTLFDHHQGCLVWFGLVFGLLLLFFLPYICITHILFSIFQEH